MKHFMNDADFTQAHSKLRCVYKQYINQLSAFVLVSVLMHDACLPPPVLCDIICIIRFINSCECESMISPPVLCDIICIRSHECVSGDTRPQQIFSLLTFPSG